MDAEDVVVNTVTSTLGIDQESLPAFRVGAVLDDLLLLVVAFDVQGRRVFDLEVFDLAQLLPDQRESVSDLVQSLAGDAE